MVHPELPKVTRCHNYKINYKIHYESVLSANSGKTFSLDFSNYVFTVASTWLCRKYMAI